MEVAGRPRRGVGELLAEGNLHDDPALVHFLEFDAQPREVAVALDVALHLRGSLWLAAVLARVGHPDDHASCVVFMGRPDWWNGLNSTAECEETPRRPRYTDTYYLLRLKATHHAIDCQ